MTDTMEQVTLPTGESFGCHVARPALSGEQRPGLLLIHDLLGITTDLERIAGRLAKAGYVTLAPDYFGSGPRPLCVVRAITTLKRGRGTAFDRLRAAHEHLAGLPDVDAARTGAVGFCLGGGFALLWSARNDVQAVANFYGDVPRDLESLRNIPPCVAGYGGRDKIFAPQGRRLERHLIDSGIDHDVKEYPKAGHAYMNQHDGALMWLSGHSPMAAGFDPAASADSWDRMLAFFGKHLAPD